MQLLIFYVTQQQLSFLLTKSRLYPCGWWAQMDFLAFGCYATKWPRHLRFSLSGGGLKWTRTIDLTLIRRVL